MVLVEVDPLPKVRARAGGLRWLGANESLQPACDTCGQIPKLAHARGVACPLCQVGCTLERDQLVALSTGASREALLSGGALLPRGVFAQSRNTRLLASGMCFERAAFIHCLAPKQTDRYHRTKACRATCLHPRYEVHHPAKTFASWRKSLQGYGPGPRCLLPSSHEASRSKRTAASRFEADMYGYFSLRGARA